MLYFDFLRESMPDSDWLDYEYVIPAQIEEDLYNLYRDNCLGSGNILTTISDLISICNDLVIRVEEGEAEVKQKLIDTVEYISTKYDFESEIERTLTNHVLPKVADFNPNLIELLSESGFKGEIIKEAELTHELLYFFNVSFYSDYLIQAVPGVFYSIDKHLYVSLEEQDICRFNEVIQFKVHKAFVKNLIDQFYKDKRIALPRDLSDYIEAEDTLKPGRPRKTKFSQAKVDKFIREFLEGEESNKNRYWRGKDNNTIIISYLAEYLIYVPFNTTEEEVSKSTMSNRIKESKYIQMYLP